METRCGIYPPHPKQLQLLSLARRTVDGVNETHGVFGRGGGKTLIACYLLWWYCVTVNRGLPHLWTSATYKDCTSAFVRSWKQVVPAGTWSMNKSDWIVTMDKSWGGADIDIRNRTNADGENSPFRSPTYAGAVLDELAKDRDAGALQLIRACVRHPDAKQKFILSISTPKLGWYKGLIDRAGDENTVYATSYDNPYVDPHWIDGLVGDYDPAFARQEVFGEFVALSSMAWDNANLDDMWPAGNIHPHEWDPEMPYTLMGDLGVHSSWLLTQRVSGGDIGTLPVDVVVAEYNLDNGDTDKLCTMISDEYGVPQRVIVGADVGTRGISDGLTSSMVFRNHWGGVQVTPITGVLANKHNQYVGAKRCINSGDGRRFCLSANMRSHSDSQRARDRGIRAVLTQDQWPDNVIRTGEYLPKEGSLEHMRDAFMYGMAALWPMRSGLQPTSI